MFPYILPDHVDKMKETYANVELISEQIQCEKYNWNILGYLKVTALLFGLQLGYTNICFLCECDSRDRKHHYIQKYWPK
jgi:hypothetical protein